MSGESRLKILGCRFIDYGWIDVRRRVGVSGFGLEFRCVTVGGSWSRVYLWRS